MVLKKDLSDIKQMFHVYKHTSTLKFIHLLGKYSKNRMTREMMHGNKLLTEWDINARLFFHH